MSAYWVKVALRNPGVAPVSRLLELAYPTLSNVALFVPRADGGFDSHITGAPTLFDARCRRRAPETPCRAGSGSSISRCGRSEPPSSRRRSRPTTSSPSWHLSPIDAAAFARSCGEYFAPACKARGVSFRVEAPEAPAVVNAEADALEYDGSTPAPR
jgi:hypothetical protein